MTAEDPKTIDGEVTPVMITIAGKSYTEQEIADSMMRHSDYTTKTSELAQQRKKLETDIVVVEQFKSFAERMKGGTREEVTREVDKIYAKLHPDHKPGSSDGGVSQEYQTRLERLEQSLTENAIVQERTALLADAKYGKVFKEHEDAIYDYAHEQGISSLSHAAKLFYADNEKFEEERIAAKTEEKLKEAKTKSSRLSDSTVEGTYGGVPKTGKEVWVKEGESPVTAFDRLSAAGQLEEN